MDETGGLGEGFRRIFEAIKNLIEWAFDLLNKAAK